MKIMKRQKYIVQNPRNLPKGTPIVQIEMKRYKEGDVVRADPKYVEHMVANGFLTEAK